MKDFRLVVDLKRSSATRYGVGIACAVLLCGTIAQAHEEADEVEATTTNVVDINPFQQQLNVTDAIKQMKTNSLMCGSLKPGATPSKHSQTMPERANDRNSFIGEETATARRTETKTASARTTTKTKANFSGVADYYADCFHGKRTASGQLHDRTKLTAAHRTLPFGTKLKVVNRKTGKSCVVTVNDRGPFTENRIIDLSMAAAKELGLLTASSRMVDCYLEESD